MWKTLAVACLFLSIPVSQLQAGEGVRLRQVMRAGARARSNRPPITIWERMADPKGWWQSRLARVNPRGRNLAPRLSPEAVARTGTPIANPIFFIPQNFDSGGRFAGNVESGDFNRDGKADLLVSNECVSDTDCSHGTVAVLPGNGDGTYGAAVVSDTAAALSRMTVGDFNRDGKLDVAVDNGCFDVGCTSGTINVLLGNGDGTFQAPVTYATGGNAFSVEAVDINGDGKPDLVVVTNPGTAGVLLGNGDGTFQPIATFSTDPPGATTLRTAVSLGDFNADGRLDLAAVSIECGVSDCNILVGVLLGNGDGTFQAPAGVRTISQRNPQAVALADVNGDHKLDLAVVEACIFEVCGSAPEMVEVLPGNGDGTFGDGKRSALGSDVVTSIQFADLDKDGDPDLITVDPDAATMTVMRGRGDGILDVQALYETQGTSPLFGVVADLNGDGEDDVAVANACQTDFQQACSGNVVVFPGTGKGTFLGTFGLPFGGTGGTALATADLNHDGMSDLVAANMCKPLNDCSAGNLAVMLARPDGSFAEAVTYDLDGLEPFEVTLGDFNGDGKLDAAVINFCGGQLECSHGVIDVLLGNGDGSFQPVVTYPSGGNFARSLVAGDFNGDGKLDLAVAQCTAEIGCFGTEGDVGVLLGNGDGTFQAAVNYSSGDPSALAVITADFNGDGKPDLAVANANCSAGEFEVSCSTGSVGVLLGNGDGTFQTAVRYSTIDLQAFSIVAGDFNHDGKVDLAVGNKNCEDISPCGTVSSVAVLLGKGDGTFQTAVTYATADLWVGFGASERPDALAAADLNGDGNPDLFLSNRNVLLGNGDGTFQAAQSYNPAAREPGGSAVVADFNGDGRPDAATGEFFLVRVLLNISEGFGHATSTALTSSKNPANLHQTVTFTAQVSSTSPGTPGGTLTFSDNGHALDSETLSNGQAAFSTNSLDAGVHSITASYGGDSTFLPSTSTVLQQVIRSATHINLTSSQNPSKRNQPVTFTAVVIADSGGPPDGAVTFKDFSTVLGKVQLEGGQAAITVTLHRKGPHLIHAIYSGSTVFRHSSAVLAQRVR